MIKDLKLEEISKFTLTDYNAFLEDCKNEVKNEGEGLTLEQLLATMITTGKRIVKDESTEGLLKDAIMSFLATRVENESLTISNLFLVGLTLLIEKMAEDLKSDVEKAMKNKSAVMLELELIFDLLEVLDKNLN